MVSSLLRPKRAVTARSNPCTLVALDEEGAVADDIVVTGANVSISRLAATPITVILPLTFLVLSRTLLLSFFGVLL
jgi:hypothetical protein